MYFLRTHHRIGIGIILILLTLAIPLTVFVSQQRQEVRQRAATEDNPRAVATFHSLGLYWRPTTPPTDGMCLVKYRVVGTTIWRDGYPLWYDQRTLTNTDGSIVTQPECRGSLVNLAPNTNYEIQLNTDTHETAALQAKTWSEQFPVARIVKVPSQNAKYTITEGGNPTDGYVVYEPENASTVINVRDQAHTDPHDPLSIPHRYALDVKAPYVIIRGFTITGANDSGIYLGHNANHIIIENNDISGWGTPNTGDQYGIDFQSGIYGAFNDSTVQQVVIQRNKIHNPATGSNSTCEKTAEETVNPNGPWHPVGPQGITFNNNGGNFVIRYNDFYSNDNHYFNDIVGGNVNYSYIGSPYRDSDIYTNNLQNNMDDAIEADGAGENVRIWGNYFNNVRNTVSTSPTSIGPIYIFRNVVDQTRACPDNHQGDPITYPVISPIMNEHGDFDKIADNANFGKGRRYLFHNTLLQKAGPNGATLGASNGLANAGIGISNTVSRNNIWNVLTATPRTYRTSCYSVSLSGPFIPDSGNSFDYDLCSLEVLPRDVQPFWGSHVLMNQTPIYESGNGNEIGSSGMYQLSPSSPGYNSGECLANFSDGYTGTAPDMGVQETGATKIEFGVNAYPSGYPLPTNNFCNLSINPTSTPTIQPTNTPAPTTTPQPTSTPVPGNTSVVVTASLEGISDEGGNTSPRHRERPITLVLTNQAGQTSTFPGTLTYNSSTHQFQGTVDLGTLPTGGYRIVGRIPQYLGKAITVLQTLTMGQNNTVPLFSPFVGDMNLDNRLTPDDYAVFSSCYNKTLTDACLPADLNDDDQVDGADYNYFIGNTTHRSGD